MVKPKQILGWSIQQKFTTGWEEVHFTFSPGEAEMVFKGLKRQHKLWQYRVKRTPHKAVNAA